MESNGDLEEFAGGMTVVKSVPRVRAVGGGGMGLICCDRIQREGGGFERQQVVAERRVVFHLSSEVFPLEVLAEVLCFSHWKRRDCNSADSERCPGLKKEDFQQQLF